jgi:tetratricopeptide (TPR) repeat protein
VTRRPRFLAFEGFRAALSRLPEGLIRVGPPAGAAHLAGAATRLGRSLPPTLASFLSAFDGADLFHETLLLGGVGPEAPTGLVDLALDPEAASGEGHQAGDLVIARAAAGDLLLLEADTSERREGRVFRIRPGSGERWLAGSSFEAWLDAFVAAERLLYDGEGEFVLDAFEPDGELVPLMAVRQAERALRKDPGAADRHFDLGVAQRRLGRLEQAARAFERATELQPENPWPWFDLGRVHLARQEPWRGASCFSRAAESALRLERGQMLAWAARAWLAAGEHDAARAAVASARAAHPELVAHLRRSAGSAEADQDEEAAAEARALLAPFEPGGLARRLPILTPVPSGPAPGRSASGRPAGGRPPDGGESRRAAKARARPSTRGPARRPR